MTRPTTRIDEVALSVARDGTQVIGVAIADNGFTVVYGQRGSDWEALYGLKGGSRVPLPHCFGVRDDFKAAFNTLVATGGADV
jgi:hypothetical protein